MKRYEIQVCHSEDFAEGDELEWKTFYGAKTAHTKRGAYREWWYWVRRDWHFTADKPLFRVWDRKKNKVVQYG